MENPRTSRSGSRNPAWLRVLVLAGAFASLACGRSTRTADGRSERGGGAGDATTGGSNQGGSTASGGGSGRGGTSGGPGEGGEGGTPDTVCPPAETPIRRLNRFEYDNTVRDLFGNASRPARTLPREADRSDSVTAPLIEGYHTLAHDFARSVSEDAEGMIAFIGCDPESDGEAACREDFIESFVGRAFRRPATTDDVAAFGSVFRNGQTLGGNFSSGVRAVVEVALQSPEFLYRPELGEPAVDKGPGWARPSPYEMASRLSYLCLGSAPDAALLEAASRDELREPAELEAQARRLLADVRARDAVGDFYLRFMRLVDAEFRASGDPAHPSFTPEIAALLPRETEAFAVDLTLDAQGDFASLLTAPHSFVNGPLAAFYGLSDVSGDEFQRVDVDATRRGGLLTHASFLASNAYGPYSNPSRRGELVLSAFLCLTTPIAPVDSPIIPVPSDMTTRQAFESHVSSPACAGCHSLLDSIGFAFEHFDAAGLWRDTDNGLPVDASGEIFETDAAGTFDGAFELSRRLAASEDVRRCFVKHWFSHAHGRGATSDDACSLDALDRSFTSENQNLLELVVALTQNDAFRYLREVTP